MDCYEKGIIDSSDTGGVELRFGNAEAMVRMTTLIAEREGFGDLLAEGSARAAEQIGKGSEELVVTVKKQELPAHMPQLKRSLALIYAANPFGADHQSSEHDGSWRHYPERMAEIGVTAEPESNKILSQGKVDYAYKTQLAYSCLDTVNMCQFVFGPAWHLYSMGQLKQAVQLITGWDVSMDELLLVGERRLNLLRAFNAREGIGREQDVLPKKLSKALTGGRSEGLLVAEEELEQAKDWYYELAGWEVETGMPTRNRLEQLELGWVADDIGI
jgi:aldehyde:ferredoxin oxidoreductase